MGFDNQVILGQQEFPDPDLTESGYSAQVPELTRLVIFCQ
jgi:hypothetical protein